MIGTHDFRNFCKGDEAAGKEDDEEQNFIRRVYSIKFNPAPGNMMVAVIVGSSFLWHQIWCTMGILFLVGQEKENPSVVDMLLDIEKVKTKPNY